MDFIIGFLFTSKVADKLSEGDSVRQKITEFMKFNGIRKESIHEVVRMGLVRAGDESLYNKALLRVFEEF